MMARPPEYDEPDLKGDAPLRSHGLVVSRTASPVELAE
jgi:hypothetical protein